MTFPSLQSSLIAITNSGGCPIHSCNKGPYMTPTQTSCTIIFWKKKPQNPHGNNCINCDPHQNVFALFCFNDPLKLTYIIPWKSTLGQGDSCWTPLFSGSMLDFVEGNDPCCKFSPKSASPKSCAGRRRFHPTVGSDMSLGSVVMATTHNRCPVGVFSSFLCSFFCACAFFFLFGLVLGLCFFLCGWNSTFFVGNKDSPKNSGVSSLDDIVVWKYQLQLNIEEDPLGAFQDKITPTLWLVSIYWKYIISYSFPWHYSPCLPSQKQSPQWDITVYLWAARQGDATFGKTFKRILVWKLT